MGFIDRHQKEVWYELFLIMDIAILASFGAITLFYFGEANDFSRVHLIYGSMSNTTVTQFDALSCAEISFKIGYWNWIPGLITAIPITIIATSWSKGKLNLPLKKLTIFPIIAIAFHLIYFSFIAHPSLVEASCSPWLKI